MLAMSLYGAQTIKDTIWIIGLTPKPASHAGHRSLRFKGMTLVGLALRGSFANKFDMLGVVRLESTMFVVDNLNVEFDESENLGFVTLGFRARCFLTSEESAI